jgi:hypothetical protein
VGVRDIGGDLSGDIETVAIEVKRGRTPFTSASGQTVGYRVFANRVYLADRRAKPFNQDELQIASGLGIGLIEIRGRKCKEVLSSPYYSPIRKLNLFLLENLALGRFQMCGSIFRIRDLKMSRNQLSREKLFKAVREGKGMVFWNEEVSARKIPLGLTRRQPDMVFDRRFVCSECIQIFFKPLVPSKQ